MKNIIRKLLVGLSVLFFVSCSLTNQKATISFTFPSINASAARDVEEPVAESNKNQIELAYTITVKNEQVKITENGVSGETISIEVQPGTYSVTVNAQNEDEGIYYTGKTENVVVIKGQDNPITVTLRFISEDEHFEQEEEVEDNSSVPDDSWKITFNANGGKGSQEEIIQPKNSEISIPACTFTPNGKKHFKYWSLTKKPSDESILYPDEIYKLTENVVIYAIWENNPKAEVSVVNPEIVETILTVGEASYNVKLTATEDAIIYYTTDGSVPTEESAVYSEEGDSGLIIKEPVTLKFIAANDYLNASDVGELQIKFRLPKVELSTSSDFVSVGDLITLSSIDGASIYYTTDGSEPVVDGDLNNAVLYEKPIEITEDKITIKATAIADGYQYSETVSREFFTFETNFNYTIVLGEETVGGFSDETSAKNGEIYNSVPTALQNRAYPTCIWLSRNKFFNQNVAEYYIETSYDVSGSSRITVKQLNKNGRYEDISDKAYVKYYYVFKSFNSGISTYEVKVDIKLDVQYSHSGVLYYIAKKGLPKDNQTLMNCTEFNYVDVKLIGTNTESNN